MKTHPAPRFNRLALIAAVAFGIISLSLYTVAFANQVPAPSNARVQLAPEAAGLAVRPSAETDAMIKGSDAYKNLLAERDKQATQIQYLTILSERNEIAVRLLQTQQQLSAAQAEIQQLRNPDKK